MKKRFFALILVSISLFSFVGCKNPVGGDDATVPPNLNSITSIIYKINEAEFGSSPAPKNNSASAVRLSALPTNDVATGLETIETFDDIDSLLDATHETSRLSYWVTNFTISDLLYYVSETTGEDALKYVYKIDHDGYFTPLSNVKTKIYSVDIKGILDNKMYGIVESDKFGLPIKIMLSAYYNSDEDYGYETFAYDYVNDEPTFLEHNKYDKATDSFLHMHTYFTVKDDVPIYDVGYGIGNKYVRFSLLNRFIIRWCFKKLKNECT